MKLSIEQQKLLNDIPQNLRRETALAYIANGYENQTKAYLDACSNMNKRPSKKPETSASEILNYPNVIAFINSVKNAVAEMTQINAMYVLNRLHEIDNLDILDIVKDDLSSFKPLSEWPRSWRTSISALDMKRIVVNGRDEADDIETIIEKVKWPDKTKNLELIGRHVNVNAFGSIKDDGQKDEIISKVLIEVVGGKT